METSLPHIVIVGAGFGGLWAARALSRAPVRVTLIERNNYHTFLPLLYQVAAAELRPEEIAYPVRGILRNFDTVRFLMAEVKEIDPFRQRIDTEAGAMEFDFLILSTGSATNYLDIEGAAAHAFPLKTLEQGIALRNHLLTQFENAAHETDAGLRRRALTFVVVGGGATGIEFAGALAELIYGPLLKDYPSLQAGDCSIVVIEGSDRLLGSLPERMGAYALKRLERKGVQVKLSTCVAEVTPEALSLQSGEVIPTMTVIWTAGVRGAAVARPWGLPLTLNGRVAVLPTLQAAGHPSVYVIGDLACIASKGAPLPMTAPVATQQGRAAAANILRQLGGQEPLPFRYNDRGTMVTIGRNAATAVIGGRVFTGFFAWLLWLGVHLFNLIGFPNRLSVFLSWAVDYFFYERTVRLILPREKNGE